MKNNILIAFLALVFLSISTIANAAGARTITLVNQCSYPVWFGFAGGATANHQEKGSVCVEVSKGHTQCFWMNPKPDNDNYKLRESGGTTTVTIPTYDNDIDTVWSGVVVGRTGCENGVCETADCDKDATGACRPGHGFNQPATQAEFTLNNSTDFYDVETINGINIPLSMAPTTHPDPLTANPYNCGSPGAVRPITKTGACTWNFTPPSDDYVWVRQGGASCKTNNDCPSSDQCGLSFNPGQQHLLKKTCGKPLGFWTADEVCGIDSSYGEPFNCAKHLPYSPAYTNTQLYACAPIASCYQPNAKSDCCGCVNWWEKGVDVPQSTTQCVNHNLYWDDHVEPDLQWIKQACPTTYTYPYDDMSSTFTCSQKNAGDVVNTTAYTITFCPK